MLPFNQGPNNNFPNPLPFNPNFQNPNFNGGNPNFNGANPNFNGGNPNNNPYFPQNLHAQHLLALQLQANLLNQIQAQAHAMVVGANPMLGFQNPMAGFPSPNPHMPINAQVPRAELNSNNSSFVSQNHANGNPRGPFPGFGNGQPSNNRFQKNQSYDKGNPKGDKKLFNRYNKPDHSNQRGKMQTKNLGGEASPRNPRYIINYPEKEIQQWREARKRNFPTRANVNKKSASTSKGNGHVADEDDKLRREQLRDILAKQAELGVEVAEIPPSYLCGPEDNENEHWRDVRRKGFQTRANVEKEFANKVNKGEEQGGRNMHKRKERNMQAPFPNKPNKKKFKRNRRHPKKNSEATNPSAAKTEPSLFQKLISADIKRDNSRLLQVFRFITLNDFFEKSSDTNMKFPLITVKGDEGCENSTLTVAEAVTAGSTTETGWDDGIFKEVDGVDAESVEEGEVFEEGEIAD